MAFTFGRSGYTGPEGYMSLSESYPDSPMPASPGYEYGTPTWDTRLMDLYEHERDLYGREEALKYERERAAQHEAEQQLGFNPFDLPSGSRGDEVLKGLLALAQQKAKADGQYNFKDVLDIIYKKGQIGKMQREEGEEAMSQEVLSKLSGGASGDPGVARAWAQASPEERAALYESGMTMSRGGQEWHMANVLNQGTASSMPSTSLQVVPGPAREGFRSQLEQEGVITPAPLGGGGGPGPTQESQGGLVEQTQRAKEEALPGGTAPRTNTGERRSPLKVLSIRRHG